MSFKPSQIDVFARSYLPFIDTFGHTEAEVAAAMMISTMRYDGDELHPVSLEQVNAWAREAERSEAHWRKLFSNPFVTPDIDMLIADGYARWVGEGPEHRSGPEDPVRPVEFTERGIARLEEKGWVADV